ADVPRPKTKSITVRLRHKSVQFKWLVLTSQLRFYLGEFFDNRGEIVAGMRGGNLRADARLALGHDGITETDHIDALGQHRISKARGERGVSKHDRHDR